MTEKLLKLKESIDGEFYHDLSSRILYSTDASSYKEKPLAIVIPKNKEDIKRVIDFAKKNNTSLIPRTAGTSLAGQVVGSGIVVDVSKYLNKILEINFEEKWVRVEPGVVLDELNNELKKYNLFFGPETSTSNRCMIGGMLGNNSCGSHSIIYGSTRDHTLSVKTILSDGSEVEFSELSKAEFNKKCIGESLENKIYRNIRDILSKEENQKTIRKEFPNPKIRRRNTGYAIDLLLETSIFSNKNKKFNFAELLAGSEGTLAFSTEIKLNLVELPPKEKAVIAAHFNSLNDALKANILALKYSPGAVELMDDIILNCTKDNITQRKNRFFVKENPAAILIIEFARRTKNEILEITANLEAELRKNNLGYYFPVISGNDIKRVWDLRKAGLGLLSNVPGDKRSTTVIEDTAVHTDDLPEYVSEFKEVLKKNNTTCIFYAHVGSGELHLRPMLNLKDKNDLEIYYNLGKEIARLVKKYRGSLSGEHGDGRLRGEFVPFMLGEHNYQLLRELKAVWDPNNIFNPGKITDAPSITENLRFYSEKPTPEIETIFDFSKVKGIVRAAEKCSGSGDCRKSEKIGGTMCPSFMASRDEKNSTRARANILQEFLNKSNKKNPFDHKEIYEIMDLCLSCKACKSECPSSVDMTKLKAEFLQHYYDSNGIPFRARAIAYISNVNNILSYFPTISNFFLRNSISSFIIQKLLGFSTKRKMPLIQKITLSKWFKKTKNKQVSKFKCGKVYLFNDEFTNFNDTDIGIKAIRLLTRLGYEVVIPKHDVSARTFLSKGLVRKAKKIANKNVTLLKEIISKESPLIGIEPSAIFSFRDEYVELVDTHLVEAAIMLSKNTFLIDEFISNEIENGKISKELFSKEHKKILLHGHCQQKAIASTIPTKNILSFPENYSVEEIPSGCCGMAGSFGYEKEHYDFSMKVGELVLFPNIRKAEENILIAADGTSCRHQIKDGTQRTALHAVEILYDALIK